VAKDLAIVLNNGSINSAVVTALASQRYRPILLHGETSAQPGSRVRAAYEQQVAQFKPYREYSIPIAFTAHLPANSNNVVADPRQTTPIAPQLIDLLPLISVAVRLAAHHEAAAIYVGLRTGPAADELAQATEYLQIWNEMIQMPCSRSELNVVAPLMELDPWQVIDVGFQVNAPFDRTWSCLENGSEPCLACRGCRAREAAFQQAAKADPLATTRKA
jgi:7-cyano-7-deazaguanine synthase in queuosine biosynthesis